MTISHDSLVDHFEINVKVNLKKIVNVNDQIFHHLAVGEAVADSQSQLEEMQSLFTDMGINTFDGGEKPVRRLPVGQTRDDGQFLAAAGFHHRHHNTTEPSGDFGGHFLAPTFHPDDSYQTGHLVSDVKPEIKVENFGEEMPFELEDYLSHESEIYDPSGDVLEVIAGFILVTLL